MDQLFMKNIERDDGDVVTFHLSDIALYSVPGHSQHAGDGVLPPARVHGGQQQQYADSVERANLVCRELSSSGDSYSAADVLVYAGKGQARTVKFHRWLLSAVSPFLASLLHSADPYQSRDRLELYLPDFNWKVVNCLATFLYQGQVKVRHRTSSHIKQLLRILQVDMVMDIERVRDTSSDFDMVYSEDNQADLIETDDVEQQTSGKPNITSVVIGMKENNSVPRKKKCDKCDKEFATNFGLKKHIRLVHMEVNDFNCEHCNKSFSCNESLKNHTRTHTGEMLSCKYDNCAKSFLNPRDLKDHENVHTKETSYLCPDCGDVFDTNKKMLNHREKHRKNDKPCNICGKLIKNFASFKAHIRAHGLERAHSCNVCGKSFKRNFDLTVHMRIHTGAKPYTCDCCGKSFSLSSTLSKHKKYHQTSGQTVPCNLCTMVFPGSKELSEHRRDVHREYIVVEENGQLIMREETNAILLDRDNISQMLRQTDTEATVEAIIMETKEDVVNEGVVQFHVSGVNDL